MISVELQTNICGVTQSLLECIDLLDFILFDTSAKIDLTLEINTLKNAFFS